MTTNADAAAATPARPAVVSLGSLNIDHVYRLPSIVQPGQTIASVAYARYPGGKGLNQSVALARAGAVVRHIGAVGRDGQWLRDALRDAGVNVDAVAVLDDQPTGHAIIQVDDARENAIILHAGANHHTAFAAQLLQPNDWLLTQNETQGVAHALAAAKARGASVAFNPAPMDDAVLGFPLHAVDLLIVNQSEAHALGDAVQQTLDAGGSVITTLGAQGANYRRGNISLHVPAEPTHPVDTTAAGDTFVGYFLASHLRGHDTETALRRAARAAALCVSRPGAMPSIPHAHEVDA